VSKSPNIIKKGRITAKSLLSRLTGFSLPFFGLQWTPPADEREIVRRLLINLEDRRVLYAPYHMEIEPAVMSSVQEMRKILEQALQDLPNTSPAVGSIRAMHVACRDFLTAVQVPMAPQPGFNSPVMQFESMGKAASFFIALGWLRATFGIHIASLAYQYDIDIDQRLKSILPPEV